MPLARPHTHLTRRGRVLRHLAVAHPTRGGIAEAMCRQMLSGLEALRLRIRWRLLLNSLLSVRVHARGGGGSERQARRTAART